MTMTEEVCCLARRDLETVLAHPLPQGAFAGPGLDAVLALPQVFAPRCLAEHDPSAKQLIPYQLFRCQGRFLVYRRGGGVGEGRLAGRLSLGIGGHINRHDAGGGALTPAGYQQALLRERQEELLCHDGLEAVHLGWINDDSDPVGQVHLGAVHLCRVARCDEVAIRPQGEDIHFQGWWTAEAIGAEAERFEKWSLLALELAVGWSVCRSSGKR